MRTLNLGVMALTLASAFLLYGINYDTRLMDQRLQEKERAIDKARSDIAVLKAERAHLARPERIEPLARALGLAAGIGAAARGEPRGGADARARRDRGRSDRVGAEVTEMA